jgi:hypothetical protein
MHAPVRESTIVNAAMSTNCDYQGCVVGGLHRLEETARQDRGSIFLREDQARADAGDLQDAVLDGEHFSQRFPILVAAQTVPIVTVGEVELRSARTVRLAVLITDGEMVTIVAAKRACHQVLFPPLLDVRLGLVFQVAPHAGHPGLARVADLHLAELAHKSAMQDRIQDC